MNVCQRIFAGIGATPCRHISANYAGIHIPELYARFQQRVGFDRGLYRTVRVSCCRLADRAGSGARNLAAASFQIETEYVWNFGILS